MFETVLLLLRLLLAIVCRSCSVWQYLQSSAYGRARSWSFHADSCCEASANSVGKPFSDYLRDLLDMRRALFTIQAYKMRIFEDSTVNCRTIPRQHPVLTEDVQAKCALRGPIALQQHPQTDCCPGEPDEISSVNTTSWRGLDRQFNPADDL